MNTEALFDISTVPAVWHLSYTGFYAGVRLCGSLTGDSSHAMYVSDARMADPNLCPTCVAVWNDDSDDES